MSKNPPEEPKLIIDEDWKTQVQREKEELKKREAEASQETPAAEGQEETSEIQEETGEATSAESSDSPPPPPPASLLLLVTTLATQAMAALGQLPDEEGKSMPVNLDYARHFIDSIGVLEEKTKGNLTSEEETYVQQTLHQLRLAFVTVRNQPSGG